MITAINFGGIDKPVSKPILLVAPLPQEYKVNKLEVVKNTKPHPVDK